VGGVWGGGGGGGGGGLIGIIGGEGCICGEFHWATRSRHLVPTAHTTGRMQQQHQHLRHRPLSMHTLDPSRIRWDNCMTQIEATALAQTAWLPMSTQALPYVSASTLLTTKSNCSRGSTGTPFPPPCLCCHLGLSRQMSAGMVLLSATTGPRRATP